jgi:hypothetical protein
LVASFKKVVVAAPRSGRARAADPSYRVALPGFTLLLELELVSARKTRFEDGVAGGTLILPDLASWGATLPESANGAQLAEFVSFTLRQSHPAVSTVTATLQPAAATAIGASLTNRLMTDRHGTVFSSINTQG